MAFYSHKIWILIIYLFYGFLWLRTNPALPKKSHLFPKNLNPPKKAPWNFSTTTPQKFLTPTPKIFQPLPKNFSTPLRENFSNPPENISTPKIG